MTGGVFVAGLGTYIPESFPAERAVELGLYSRDEYEASGWTGAAVAGDLSAPDMAVRAANQALARSGHRPSEVGLIEKKSLKVKDKKLVTKYNKN